MNALRMCSLLFAGGMLVLPSCAWANPANRPIWNAFEANLVPESDGWFYVALPVTAPLGLGAVLLDTFVAHPLQIVDDSVQDAGELWVEDDPDFADEYYTEMAWLPFRTVFTPLVFLGSFAGRSLFDIREPLMDEEREQARRERAQRREQASRTAFVVWLRQVVQNPSKRHGGAPPDWHESFAEPLAQALAGNALVRRAVHAELIGARRFDYGSYRPQLALRDADPVVRYTSLRLWPSRQPIATDVLEALKRDRVEAVRLLARSRF